MYKVITHSSYHDNRIPFYTTNLQLFHNFAKWVSRRVVFIAAGNELKFVIRHSLVWGFVIPLVYNNLLNIILITAVGWNYCFAG